MWTFPGRQAETFKSVVESLQARGVELGTVHLLSSYAAVNYPEYAYDYARLGILMFGVKSSRRTTCGRTCSHAGHDPEGPDHLCAGDRTRGDGELRPDLPGGAAHQGGLRLHRLRRRHPPLPQRRKAAAIVRGQYAQGIGRICMDQLMLDVTGIEDVRVGDEAVFIGRQGDCVIYAEELAENAGTITNELFSRLGARVEGRCFRQEA